MNWIKHKTYRIVVGLVVLSLLSCERSTGPVEPRIPDLTGRWRGELQCEQYCPFGSTLLVIHDIVIKGDKVTLTAGDRTYKGNAQDISSFTVEWGESDEVESYSSVIQYSEIRGGQATVLQTDSYSRPAFGYTIRWSGTVQRDL